MAPHLPEEHPSMTMVEQHFHPEPLHVDDGRDHAASSAPHILSQRRPPTIHDPTIKPPWKKHKGFKKPPTSDWAMLWPRPANWYCPYDASAMTNYAGCHYIEVPEVFDPEIEKLPDWMGPEEVEGRFWYGVDRVVYPEPLPTGVKTDEKAKVGKREYEVGEEEEEGLEVENSKAVLSRVVAMIPHPPPEAHKTHSTLSSTATSTLPSTLILAPTLESTLTLTPTPTSESIGTADPGRNSIVANILVGAVFPFLCIGAFILICVLFHSKCKKAEQEKAKAGARARAAAKSRTAETEARDSRYQVSDRGLEEGRAVRTSEEEVWDEVTLRDFTVG